MRSSSDRAPQFLAGTGAVLLAAPLAAEAQWAGNVYRISFLGLSPGEDTTSMKPLLERLHELSYSEGRTMTFEYRSAEGRPERLPLLATELVRASPDILIALKTAKALGLTIPPSLLGRADEVIQ
jgi:putative ABC transport system substrate-binding protein